MRTLIDRLDEHPSGHVPPTLQAARALARARLSSAEEGRSAAVDEAFENAIEQLRLAAIPYHLAHGLLDHADYLRAHGRGDDAARDEAVLIGERLGSVDIAQRAAALGVPQTVTG